MSDQLVSSGRQAELAKVPFIQTLIAAGFQPKIKQQQQVLAVVGFIT